MEKKSAEEEETNDKQETMKEKEREREREIALDMVDIYLPVIESNSSNKEIPSPYPSGEELEALYTSILFQRRDPQALEKLLESNPSSTLPGPPPLFPLLVKSFLMALYGQRAGGAPGGGEEEEEADGGERVAMLKRGRELAREVVPLLEKEMKGREGEATLRLLCYFLGLYYTTPSLHPSSSLTPSPSPSTSPEKTTNNSLDKEKEKEEEKEREEERKRREWERGIVYLQQAADLGSPAALTQLGLCYMKGSGGVGRDEFRAFEYFLQAAEKGYAGGEHSLSLCLEKGFGCEKNLSEAMKYEKRAAEKNHLAAIHRLALLLEKGKGGGGGVEKDEREAMRLHRLAAEMGHEGSQFLLAAAYEKGKHDEDTAVIIQKDPQEAFRWYLACAGGGGERATGRGGHPVAQLKAALFYEKGQGVQQNEVEAFRWCHRSALQGDFIAQHLLGTFYEKGLGCSVHLEEARKWYQKSAQQGYSPAQFNYGRCIFKGFGLEDEGGGGSALNLAEGLKWHRLSANQGEYSAQKSLSHCYKHGIGTEVNLLEKKKWSKLVQQQKDRIQSMGKSLPLKDVYVSRKQSLDEQILQQHQQQQQQQMLLLQANSSEEEIYWSLSHDPTTPVTPLLSYPITPSSPSSPTRSRFRSTSTSASGGSSLVSTTITGKVFKRKNINDNKDYLVKYIPIVLYTAKLRRHQQKHRQEENFFTEQFYLLQLAMDTLIQINHPHISCYYQNFFHKISSERYFCVVTEYLEYQPGLGYGGSENIEKFSNTLKKKIIEASTTSYDYKCLWLKQCLEGLTYLHKKNIFHYNLTPEGLCFLSENCLKITDVTPKNLLYPPLEKDSNSRSWLSPVMKKIVEYQQHYCYLSYEKYKTVSSNTPVEIDGSKDDFWTLGCIFAEVLLGKRLKDIIKSPFELFFQSEDHLRRKETLLAQVFEKEKLLTEGSSRLISNFILNSWKESSERLTLADYYLKYFLPEFSGISVLADLNQSVEVKFEEEEIDLPTVLPIVPQVKLPQETNISPAKAGSPRARHSITSQPEDEKQAITSDLISELYEFIRLNKIKLKKLEKLAYKKNSMIAKGFLMTLHSCDSLYFDYSKAQKIARELIVWLEEQEQLMALNNTMIVDHEDENALDQFQDENVEYIMFFLGVYYSQHLYEQSQMVGRNPHQPYSPRRIEGAEEKSDPPSQMEEKVSEKDKVESAVPFFLQSVEHGYLTAQNNLGVCYARGIGVPKDYDEAVRWFRMSAGDGNELGQYNLGICYEKGLGVRVDKIEALRLFQLSSEQGCAAARSKLGECYEYGIGAVVSYSEAVKWYKISADQGYCVAQYHLGICYEKGRGVNKDYDHAFKWYRLSAEQGYPAAQFCLALCYENGLGTVKNPEEAAVWYEKNLHDQPHLPFNNMFIM